MFYIGLSYIIMLWSFMKIMQNNNFLFFCRSARFYTLKFFPWSHKCSIRHPPVSKYQLPLPSLVTLLLLLMQNAHLILELRYGAHFGSSNWTKSSLIVNMTFQGFWRYFQCIFFVMLKMNWSQLDLIVLAELQTAWNISLAMSSCLCIAGNTNLFACFLWFSHLSD